MSSQREGLRRPAPIADRWRINLGWFLRLRWGAIAGQLATIFVVHRFMHIELPLTALLVLVGAELATNGAAALVVRGQRPVPHAVLPALMILDVLVLTG